MISEIKDLGCDGFRGIFTDIEGNRAKARGTFALTAPSLSWTVEGLGYVEVGGIDQGVIIPKELRIDHHKT